jgi:hypothetical protein
LIRVNKIIIPGQNIGHRGKKYCSKTALLAAKACKSETRDDYWIAKANCLNITDSGDRAECEAEAKDEQKEGRAICKDQQNARKELCGLIGENQYEPDDIGDAVPVNPCFPLVPGAWKGYYRCLSASGMQKSTFRNFSASEMP